MLRVDDLPVADVSRARFHPRRRGRDRRTGLAAVIASLSEHLCGQHSDQTLASRFESGLSNVLGVDAIRLRQHPRTDAQVLPSPNGHCERATLDVPTCHGSLRTVMEVEAVPGSRLDDWDRQVLGAAAHLASLVVALDYRRGSGSAQPAVLKRPPVSPPELIGTSAVMCGLRENIQRVAATDFTVLIQGESGTGKELVARQIHELSRRQPGPFIAVNCAAIVESLLEAELFGIEDRTATGVRGRRGKFEHAEGGTLFLDEVSDLAPAAQAKLLRAIQELTIERVGGHVSRKVNTRIVVATNRSLRDLATRGLFREDLFYRLSGVELRVPPLRGRAEDIPELTRHFLARYQTPRQLSISPEAAEAMRVYDWPGNVRELERMVEGAVTLARTDSITIDDLPSALRTGGAEVLLPALSHNETMRACGARYARLVYDKCEQNKRKACRMLDISYHTLQAYLRWTETSGTPAPSAGPEWLPGNEEDEGLGDRPGSEPTAAEATSFCG